MPYGHTHRHTGSPNRHSGASRNLSRVDTPCYHCHPANPESPSRQQHKILTVLRRHTGGCALNQLPSRNRGALPKCLPLFVPTFAPPACSRCSACWRRPWPALAARPNPNPNRRPSAPSPAWPPAPKPSPPAPCAYPGTPPTTPRPTSSSTSNRQTPPPATTPTPKWPPSAPPTASSPAWNPALPTTSSPSECAGTGTTTAYFGANGPTGPPPPRQEPPAPRPPQPPPPNRRPSAPSPT